MPTDKDEMVVTSSILSFMLRGPKSAIIDENDDNESTLVCRAYNPTIKIFDRHYVETKIILDVQCEFLLKHVFFFHFKESYSKIIYNLKKIS